MNRYNFKLVEKKWQDHWKKNKTYKSSLNKNKISIISELFSLDGSKKFFRKSEGNISDFKELGLDVGNFLKIESKNCYKR